MATRRHLLLPRIVPRRRKPIRKVIKAFGRARGEHLRLLVNAQVPRNDDKLQKWAQDDPRIELMLEDEPEDEHRARFASCDVCLAPSRWEGLGLPLFEATAFGLPIITNDKPPMAEMVLDGRSGILVPSERNGEARSGIPAWDPDVPALTAAIERLGDRDELERLRAGVAELREQRSWERTVADLGALADGSAGPAALPCLPTVAAKNRNDDVEGLDEELRADGRDSRWERYRLPVELESRSFLDVGCWEGVHCADAVRHGSRRRGRRRHLHERRAAQERRPLRVRVPADGRLRRALPRPRALRRRPLLGHAAVGAEPGDAALAAALGDRRAAGRRDDDDHARRRPADDALPGRRRGHLGQVELVGAEPRLPGADARGDRLRGDLDRLGGRAARGLRPRLRPRGTGGQPRPAPPAAAQAEADEHPRRQPAGEPEARPGRFAEDDPRSQG